MTTTSSDYVCKANHYYKWSENGNTYYVKMMYHFPCMSIIYVRYLEIVTSSLNHVYQRVQISNMSSNSFEAMEKMEITSDVFDEAFRDVIGGLTAIQQKEFDDMPIEWVHLFVEMDSFVRMGRVGNIVLYCSPFLCNHLPFKRFLVMARQRFKIARLCSSDNYRLSRKIAAYYRDTQLAVDTMDVRSHRCHVKDLIAEGKHPHVMCFGSLVKLSLSDAAKVCKDMEIVWK